MASQAISPINHASVVEILKSDLNQKTSIAKPKYTGLFNKVMEVSLAMTLPIAGPAIYGDIEVERSGLKPGPAADEKKTITAVITMGAQSGSFLASLILQNTFFDYYCTNKCTKDESCGGYFDFFSCNNCISNCKPFLFLQAAFLFIPATLGALGALGHVAEQRYVKRINSAHRLKHQAAIKKIKSVVESLKLLKSSPFLPNSLNITSLELSLDSRRKLINGMNFTQLMDLGDQIGSEELRHFAEGIIKVEQLELIDALLKINKFQNLLGLIHQLRPKMLENHLIWDETVKRLSPSRFQKVEEELKDIGERDLNIRNVNEEISYLRTFALNSTDFIRTLKSLEQREDADIPLSDTEHYISSLSDEERYGFERLIRFFKDRREDINKELEHDPMLALSILILASRFGLKSYLIICYNYLLKNQDKFELPKLIYHLLTSANFGFLYETNKAFVKRHLIEACKSPNSPLVDGIFNSIAANEYLLVNDLDVIELISKDKTLLEKLFKCDLPITQDKIKDLFVKQINTDINDTRILSLCSGISTLSEDIEDAFFGKINKHIFKDLWDYAESSNKVVLKDKCLDFLETLTINEIEHDILSKWELGQVPDEISDFIEELYMNYESSE